MTEKTPPPKALEGEAKKFYAKNFPLLFGLGAITETDYELFLVTCDAWADVVYWTEKFNIDKKKESEEAQATWEAKARAIRQYLALSSKVGMTALDRGKVKREKKEKEREIEKFGL